MKEYLETKTKKHDKAVSRLVEKLFINYSMVGKERVDMRDNLVNIFRNKYSDRLLRPKKFSGQDMCIIASRPTYLAHLWHKTYSVGPTKVLEKYLCVVTSNILEIGTAESNWKLVKAVKFEQRATTSTLKC